MDFEAFGLDPRIMAGIKTAGYAAPTPIQAQTIPSALKGRDIMGLAQTGTGKTAAFVLPILERLLAGPRRKVRALVITPTRELAEQTNGEFRVLGAKTKLKSMSIYGGVAMAGQIKNLRAGAEIVVACPGRLLDHMRQGMVELSSVEVLVLDEADRMLDMGFLPEVRSILRQVPKKRQTLLFSATMPDDIRRLADDVMHRPVAVQIDHSKPARTVSHFLYPVEPHLKTPLLIGLLKRMKDDTVLVFTRTRVRTNRLSEQLGRAGFQVASLQGGMPQGRRQAALNGFRDGTYRVLVATDIAARGIDVVGISHVINYDMPDNLDAYTHRIGRTGRASRPGTALSLVTPDDGPAVRAFERVMEAELVCRELDGFDYNTPAPPLRAASRSRGAKKQRQGGTGKPFARKARGNAPSGAGHRRKGVSA